jgi:hypothetical protein
MTLFLKGQFKKGGWSRVKLKFTVKTSSANPTKTVVTARDFQIIIDEPKDLGGTDDGPNPVEYVLCQWPFENTHFWP